MAIPRPPAYGSAVRPRLLASLLLLAAYLPALAQDEETETFSEDRPTYHVYATAWGGTLPDLSNRHSSAGLFGGELAYSFSALDVGVLVQGYHLTIPDQSFREWTPVLLLRIEERFETRRGLDAVLALGLGAARTGGVIGTQRASEWQAWYQFALGLRLGLGPLFIAGEIGFEQLDLLRLAAGVGFRI